MQRGLIRCIGCLVLLLSVLCAGGPDCLVQALESGSDEFAYGDSFYYRILSDREVEVTRAKATVTAVEIPEQINGCPVTRIGAGAFYEKRRLMRLVIPDSIRFIGDYAFYNCERLTVLDIPETVQEIGMGVLKGTEYLRRKTDPFVMEGNCILLEYHGEETDVEIPAETRVIAPGAFENCDVLERVKIPESVREIGSLAFAGCSQLRSCIVPEGVLRIGSYAFNSCTSLQTVIVADSVQQIGNHAFAGCCSLEHVELPGQLERLEGALFMKCSSLQEVRIPMQVRIIEDYAFYGCSALEQVVLPPLVQVVGMDVFAQCNQMEKCTVYNKECRVCSSALPEQTLLCAAVDSITALEARELNRSFAPLRFCAGDVNADGILDIADVAETLAMYAGFAAGGRPDGYAEQALYAADVNCSGKIDIADAAQILQTYAILAAGLEEEANPWGL